MHHAIAAQLDEKVTTLALNKIIVLYAKVGTFPPSYALIATIIHLLFHYFLLHRSLLHF